MGGYRLTEPDCARQTENVQLTARLAVPNRDVRERIGTGVGGRPLIF